MRQKRNIKWIFFGVVGISVLAWFMHTFAPINAYLIVIFFLIIMGVSYCFLLYLINNVRHAFLLSMGISAYLLLRLFHLRELWYLIPLLVLLASLELYLRKR